MRRLENMVAGRTVAVVLHGASVAGLESAIHDLARAPWIWASVNVFAVTENILRPAGVNLSLVQCGGRQELRRRIDMVLDFLERPADNLFMTTIKALDKLDRPDRARLLQQRNKLVIAPYYQEVPVPNSLSMMLEQLNQAGAARAVVFGADGCTMPAGHETMTRKQLRDHQLLSYYPPLLDYYHADRVRRGVAVATDTEVFNKRFENWSGMPVVNCSPGTAITAFPVTDYGELVRTVKKGGLS